MCKRVKLDQCHCVLNRTGRRSEGHANQALTRKPGDRPEIVFDCIAEGDAGDSRAAVFLLMLRLSVLTCFIEIR